MSGDYLNTLGIAQYRTGRYEEALQTLTRSSAMNGGNQVSDLAFLAMTYYRLGRLAEASATLLQLQASRNDRWSEQQLEFLREAVSLLGG